MEHDPVKTKQVINDIYGIKNENPKLRELFEIERPVPDDVQKLLEELYVQIHGIAFLGTNNSNYNEIMQDKEKCFTNLIRAHDRLKAALCRQTSSDGEVTNDYE